MIKNYITTAIRNLLKNRLYALINILGLAIGLAVYVFGTVLVDYERSHDRVFANVDRIYTVGSLIAPTANIGLQQTDSVHAAFLQHIETNMSELDAVAYLKRQEYLVTVGDNDFYQEIRFASPGFTKIFDLSYVYGDANALADPSSIIITETTSERLFGDANPVGQTITLDHSHALTVTAVINDLPANTHFNASLFGEGKVGAIAQLSVLEQTNNYDPTQDWNNLSLGDRTYLLAPVQHDSERLQASLSSLFETHAPEDMKERLIADVILRPLGEANTFIWDAIGMPILGSISILSLLVLVVASVNYANLATAQNIGRTREVGLRRTLGAMRRQLLIQFLTESLVLTSMAMTIAIVLLELVVPLFNQVSGKVVSLNFVEILPWLAATVLAVAFVSGGYPAYQITRSNPIQALRDGNNKGGTQSIMRSAMIGLQFVIAIFMLAAVMVMYFQNQKVRDTINLYPTDQILVLERLDVDGVRERVETLKTELKRLPGVVNVSVMSQVPFDQSNSTQDVTPKSGDESVSFNINRNRVDHDFLAALDIPLVAGRDLSLDVAADSFRGGDVVQNVIVNELAAEKLGFTTPEAALGQTYFELPGEGETVDEQRQFTIVGVVENQNFLGFHNVIKPFQFEAIPGQYNAAVRFKTVGVEQTLRDIEAVWERVIPDYPIQRVFLSETFEGVYGIFRAINMALAAFAALALSLALIGLFGLAAFMAEQRTKEIGIRRVMGANVQQVVRLLIWQFSKPVIWALLLALPLAYLSMNIYLDFFTDRISLPIGIIAIAGLIGVCAAWGIVAMHAVSVARANPIKALRYE